jgi:PKD repeat protein
MSGPKSVTATFKLKADFDATPTSGQAPMAVQFTDLSITGATSWSWTFGDGGTSTLQNPVHMYKTPAEYPARYTVSLTANGATTTKSDFIILDSVCSNPPYKIGNAAPAPYPNIQAAYDSMGNATMQLQALVFSTGLMLNKPYNITLQGGYGCDFTSNPGDTILSDKLTIKDGKVTIEKLTIK